MLLKLVSCHCSEKPHHSGWDETDYSLSHLNMPTIRLFTGSEFLKEFLLTIFQLLFKGFYDHLKEGTTKLYCGPLNHCKWASNDNRDSYFKTMKLLICLSLQLSHLC